MKPHSFDCKTCGKIKTSPVFTDNSEEAIIIPTSCITLLGFKRYLNSEGWKGEYENDDIEIKSLKLSHTEIFEEDNDNHSIGEIECYTLWD